jgi:transcriptional regulator with XRE-family HTH domain
MNQKGVTAYRVAKDTGLSTGLFSQWKKRMQKPSMDKLNKLADYFGVSVDYLSGNEQKEKAPSQNEKNPEDITFDDFTYAMHNESGNLSEEDKEILLNLARDLAKHRIEKDKREGK